ncbi:unnamed protein product [Phyllotreta striolata]|uniref:Uncharacterized protein n=1 Tax=Phyllotreta striolata TaxID=444603 RepID=A0A9N9TGJ4_PHYSR|nr:unnamed protein product [Phyllotreta striolata]
MARWESSKRPLYVKTVWKDGQRHVLLGEQRQQESDRKPGRRLIEVQRPVRSAVTSSLVNLEVSSVRLLDSEEVLMKRRCKTGARKRSKIDSKSMNGERLKENCDVSESKVVEKISEACLNSVQFKQARFVDDNLAEKVLVWLDLATQNGQFPAYVNMEHPVDNQNPPSLFKKRRVFTKKRCFSSYHEHDFEIFKPLLHVESISPILQVADVLKNASESPIDEEKIDYVSSVLEDNYPVENIDSSCREHPKSSIKRQLHIFLPNMKKKSGVSDSDLSYTKCIL